MKIEPLLIIGSKQANAFIGSCDGWCSCITSACGMGGMTPMVIEICYEGDSDL